MREPTMRKVWLASALILAALPAHAATITVTDLTDTVAGTPPGSGAGVSGDLRHAIANANSGDVIQFACTTAPCTITLNGPLPPIQTSLTIDGGSRGRIVIDGRNLYRAFFADNGTIAISNLRIQNVRAKGGNGGSGGGSVSAPGGGGAGLGAGLFVSTAAVVTLTAVDFANVAALGGTGGSSVSVIGPASGGGGGLGGDGGNGQTGGNGAGGGGVLGAGSDNSSSAGGDGGLGGGGGGAGDRPGNASGTGGTGYGSAAAGGNGNSADSGVAYRGAGGNGGFGGGGGGAPNPSISGGQSLGLGSAGNGGFGGGGGGADQQTDGGIPGAGGGGGGSSNLPVSGGVLMSGLRGGQGNNSRAGGGGGAAAGPAIFVYQGSITIATSTIDGATATGGAGGTATWNSALGGTAGGANDSPIFNYDGNVNGTTTRGPVAGILVAGLQGLTVTSAGTGTGTVTSSAGGIGCPGTCSTDIRTYTDVTLTATAASDSTFAGWSGDCSGTATAATLTSLTAAQACTATFTLIPVTPATPTTPSGSAALPSFVASPVPPALDAGSGGNGTGSLSLAAYFPNPASLSFNVGGAGGAVLPSWLAFDGSTATFTYQVPASSDAPFADRAADMRSAWPNTLYPPVLRVAKLPVTVSAAANGQTYTVTVEMSFYSPRNSGVMAAASIGIDGTAGNAASGRSSLSFDGGQVVFESRATNLFAGSTNSFTDIVRYHGLSGSRDRLSQTAIPGGGVANAANGASLSPSVSADGRWAAFASEAPGITLIPSARVRQIYRASLAYPRVPLNEAATPAPGFVSMTAAGVVGDGQSDNPAISQDGRYVAFDSVATNLAAGLDGSLQVWRKDLATGDLLQVGAGRDPSISWDGRLIAYEGEGGIVLKDISAGISQLVGPGNTPRLSAKGDRLVYVNAGKIMLGGQAITDGDQPGLSADGRFVVYRSGSQVWVRDIDREVSALVSQNAVGMAATGDSGNPAISGDGSTISFTSTARDLVGGNLAAGQLYLAANPLPLPDRTGYWYQANAASGQGWVIERWGSQAYVGGLIYDTSGQATWMTGFCTLTGLACQGSLSNWSGGTAFGAAGPAAPVAAAGPGFTLTSDGRAATLSIGSNSFALSPFPIGGTATTAYAGLPQAGWWYEPASGKSGNGYFLGVNTQVSPTGAVTQMAYLSILTFDAQGRAVWYAAQGALGPDLSATLYQYSGGAAVSGTAVGQLRLTFDGTDRATLNLPNSRTASITRWRF